ncbi:LytR C-terminal domain-containing protein [Arcanobacterium hippocoleae]
MEVAKIKARVFNASKRSGLAQEVNQKLGDQGVQVGNPANWESSEVISDPVRLLTTKDSINAAYTLRAFFPDAAVVIDENAQSGTIDVVIGKGWKEMQEIPAENDYRKAMEAIAGCVPASS